MHQLFLFVLMNGLVFAGAGLIVRFGLRLGDRLAIALGAAVVGWVAIVVGLETLGLFGLIRLGPAMGLAAVVFGFGMLCYWVGRSAPADWGAPPDLSPRAPNGPSATGRAARVAAWLAIALAAWAIIDVLVVGLCSPVLVVSDAPIYHLFFAVRWWQAGTIEMVPTPFGESAAPYFPASGDVWFTWLILPWRDETVAKVGQWPFLVVGMVAVFALAREFMPTAASALAAALWSTASPPLFHSRWADVDLAMAAWYLVSVWFLVRCTRRRNEVDLALAALAAGASLGTKYVAMLFVAALVVWGAVVAWQGPNRLRRLVLLAAGVAAPSGYWFLRNWWTTGNPLYPLHLELFGVPVLRGWYSRESLLSSRYHFPTDQLGVLAELVLRGINMLLSPLWLAGLAAAALDAARGKRLPAVLACLVVLHVALFWWINPYQTQERFLFAAFGMWAVLAVLVIQRWSWLYPLLTAGIAVHLVVWPSDLLALVLPNGVRFAMQPLPAPMAIEGMDFMKPLVVGRVVLLLAIGGAILAMALPTGGRRRPVALTLAGVVLAAGLAFRVRQSFIAPVALRFYPVWREGGFLDGWLRLESASTAGGRVAYAGTNLPYYLFGIGLRNDVRYVNITADTGFRMHDYHRRFAERGEGLAANSTPDWDRREPDESAWLRNLRERRINLLFIGLTNRAGGLHNIHDGDGFPIERTWADRRPDVFRLLHADRATRVYAVAFR
jgi:hypothetical protein